MFDLKIIKNIKNQDDELKKVYEALDKLNRSKVLVGIPADKNGRKEGDGVNNAELLYIHTHGSALKNIPKRPVIEPAIEDDKAVIGELLGEAVKAVMNGNESDMMNALNKVGARGMSVSQLWFDNPKNNWKKLKPKTIERKKKKSDKILVDTDEMRKSITYVVEEQ